MKQTTIQEKDTKQNAKLKEIREAIFHFFSQFKKGKKLYLICRNKKANYCYNVVRANTEQEAVAYPFSKSSKLAGIIFCYGKTKNIKDTKKRKTIRGVKYLELNC